jgi:1-deoxy-D-xylulose-5-phosphate reductoisomerase
MKKSIAILGSTGSIGQTTLNIINKKKNLFIIDTLVANKNYQKISKQITKYKPNNFIINDIKTFVKIKLKFKNKKIKLFNNYNSLKKKNKKVDITVAAIPGIAGLEPTILFTKKSKKLLIANKEAIICGWKIIHNIAKQNKTKILSIDSEHFSINRLVNNFKESEVEKIYITASGGPFLKLPKKKFKKIKPSDAIKHPKWNMGKKISIDSATLMNKVLELVEAQKIFPFKPEIYEIIIHPESLVHAIVKFKNGLTKFLYHEPDMAIPIANAIFENNLIIGEVLTSARKNLYIKNLNFLKADKKRFPILNILPKMNKYPSTPIIVNASNEILIDSFLKKKISFSSISAYLFKVFKSKNYKKYAIKPASNLKSIYSIDNWARETIKELIFNNKKK